MVFGLFRGNANRKLIERLHGELVARARDPLLFTDYGLADTLEGRFDSVVLHAALVLPRIGALSAPGPDIAQDLADAMFRHFDAALREVGFADTRVPKEMKALAEAYGGRAKAYQEAMQQGEAAMAQALSRNVYAGRSDGRALARYVMQAHAALADTTLPQILAGHIPFARLPRLTEEVSK